MKMSALRLTALFVFIICTFSCFVSCTAVDTVVGFFADDGKGHVFKYAISSSPETLDPQLLTDKSAVVVAKNLFAGLMDYDESGRLICRMARDYTVSPDGLTYTFYIKEGFKWRALGNYEIDVTAGDFVFGFRRLMDPKLESPHSEKYFCIAGAEAARNGGIPVEDIGVRTVDDYTVEFTLEYPNAEFLYLLAELPAMPCCEHYFESTGGKYGLEADAICTNGPFFVRYWLHDPYGKDNYIRLRRNPGYNAADEVAPAGINFLVTKDSSERSADFYNGSTEALLFSAGTAADTDGNAVCQYADTVGLVFNENIAAFSTSELRQIMSWGIDREAVAAASPEILKPANSLVPDNPVFSARGYDSSISEEITGTNLAMAEYKWSFSLSDIMKNELAGATVMVPQSFGYSDCLNVLTDGWYKLFGINFSIEIVNEKDYENRIKSGDYDIALVNLHAGSPAVSEYLKPFGKAPVYGISVDEAVSAESEEGRYTSLSTYNYRCAEAENAILSQYHFIPLWHTPTVLLCDDDAQGLRLDAFSGAVLFEDARMY